MFQTFQNQRHCWCAKMFMGIFPVPGCSNVILQLADNEGCFPKKTPFQTNVCCHCADKICQHRHNFCTATHYSTAESVRPVSYWPRAEFYLVEQNLGDTSPFKHWIQLTDMSNTMDFKNVPLLFTFFFFLSWMTTDQINEPICLSINANIFHKLLQVFRII